MKKRAIITGANGMLADALWPLLKKKGYEVLPTDITGENGIVISDIKSVNGMLGIVKEFRPDIIFHLAAETDVDKCELQPEHAYDTNWHGTENIAQICKELDIEMVYISTGSVFDGEKKGGYTESDKPNPISIYGMSKLRGEEAVQSLLKKYYIVRAGWMIGGHNKDKKFVWKIVQLLNTKKEISVVTDKTGSPTFTSDFSRGIVDIVGSGKYGLYHCVNKGICTRYDIAVKIAEYLRKKDVVIKPVTSDVFPLPAPRGKSEAMVNNKLAKMGLDHSRSWQDALKEYLKALK
ncbi:MAG: dTDP-4-dehydrorhamnose reductase [Candidatus Omnitrophota bacterium]|jgi:dTDP-4-dehydrorhamnose reductase